MSDSKRYVTQRKTRDTEFAADYDSGYTEFKLGVVLRELRETTGLTQEALAKKLHTKKSAISRIEKHAENIRLSTLFKLAAIFGKRLSINFK